MKKGTTYFWCGHGGMHPRRTHKYKPQWHRFGPLMQLGWVLVLLMGLTGIVAVWVLSS